MKTSDRPISRNGGAGSTSSPADFPASRSAAPDEERERLTTATSGRSLLALSRKSGPLGSLVKTLLESFRWFSPARRLTWQSRPIFSVRRCVTSRACGGSSATPSATTSRNWDIPSSRSLYRLAPSERPTGATECSLLPTVTATDEGTGRVNRGLSPGAVPRPTLAKAVRTGLLPTVQTQGLKYCGEDGSARPFPAELLPTPNASEADHYSATPNPRSQAGSGLHALAVNGLLCTPRSNDATSLNLDSPALAARHRGNLEEQLARAQQTAGRRNTGGGSPRLNPLFVEEMMGFPLMWTALPFLTPDGGGSQ